MHKQKQSTSKRWWTMIKVINLKDFIYPDVAVAELEREIEICKLTNVFAIIAIHGYGSHGVGGEIKAEVLKSLKILKRHKKIVNYFKGEQWTENNACYLELTRLEPELILNDQINNLNSGVTIIWIQK